MKLVEKAKEIIEFNKSAIFDVWDTHCPHEVGLAENNIENCMKYTCEECWNREYKED